MSFKKIAIIIVLLSISVWAQTQVKIKPSDGSSSDDFGISVSIDGDYAIVGARYYDDDSDYYNTKTNSGAAYIFKRSGTSWTQEAKLTASDASSSDYFGYSVSISGDYAVVGAYADDDNGSASGSAYVFKRSGTAWSQEAKLTGSDGASNDYFGISVAISDSLAIMGAYRKNSYKGAAYIFKRSGTTWTQDTTLTASDGAASDYFGISVSISGNYAAVSAFRDDDKGTDSGSVYFFKRSGTTWSQDAKLSANDGQAYDYFGYSVSLSGDYAVVGAYLDNDKGSNAGSAYIFKYSGTSWAQEAKLTANDGASSDYFGYSVSISGDYTVVGTYRDDDKVTDSGSAYIFKRNGTTWSQHTKFTASDGAASDYFGWSVGMSGQTPVVGAIYDDDNGSNSGSAYIINTLPPATPSGLAATPGSGQVTLKWTPNTESNFKYYYVYGGTTSNPTTRVDTASGGVNDTTKTITGLNNGTTYYYRLTAVDTAGNESGYSTEVSAKPSLFTDISAGLTGVRYSSTAWGDYDNDGDLDILVTGYNGSSVAKVYKNTNGSFSDISAGLTGVYYSSVAWGDYDNDGDLDILLTGYNGSYITKVYKNTNGSFSDISAGLTGVYIGSVAWGDYDNDGDLDILLTGHNGSTYISKVYKNTNGSFSDISAGLDGVYYSSVAWGDYDNDGDLDILLTGYSGTYAAKVYRNNGDETFTNTAANLTGVYNSSAAWGDYDNDGDLDILLSGYSPTAISKIYTNSSGSFSDISAGLTGVQNSSAAWGDYDNDGDLDVLLTGYSSSNSYVANVYRNEATSANSVPAAPTTVSSAVSGTMVTLKWNRASDTQSESKALTYNLRVGTAASKSDMVGPMAVDTSSASNHGYRRIPALGNTNHDTTWSLTLPKDGTYYWSVQAIDNAFAGSPFATEVSFTADFAPSQPSDLAILLENKQVTLIWNANSESDFKKYYIYGGTSSSPTTKVDSTSSGANDTTKTITGLTNGTTYYYRITAVDTSGNESAYSSQVSGAPGDYAAPSTPSGFKAIAGNQQVTLTWSPNSESDLKLYRIYGGTSSNPTTKIDSATGGVNDTSTTITGLTNSTTYYYRITAVDTAGNASSYSNEASAKPSLLTDISAGLAGVYYSSTAWGDYDNDGDLDILLTGYDGSSYISKVYKNTNGIFTDISAGLTGVYYGSVAWGDYDNDGDLDILLTGHDGSSYISKVYKNTNGSFSDISAGLPGHYSGSADWGDYDNDGDLDILITGYDYNGGYTSKIYKNTNGSFSDISAGLTGVYESSADWGDYDNDGDLDILLTGHDGSNYISKIYKNTNGSFSDISAGLAGVYYSSTAWGDYNNDGDLDILLTGYDGSNYISKIYKNTNGSFSDISAGLTGVYLGSAAWGDYDNDGDLDILLTGYGGYPDYQTSKVYRNEGGSFSDISAGLSELYYSSVAWGDYDTDGDLDFLLTGYSGSYEAKVYRNNASSANSAPTAPTGLSSTVSDTMVSLKWSRSTDTKTDSTALTYNLRVGTATLKSDVVGPMAVDTSTASNHGYRRIPALGNMNHNTTWNISITKDGTYHWSVQAIDNAFAGSAFATEETFTVDVAPVVPTGLTAEIGSEEVTLRWNKNDEADLHKYNIYYDTTTTVTLRDSVVAASLPDTFKTITGLTNHQTYYFRITAVDSTGKESAQSDVVTATPAYLGPDWWVAADGSNDGVGSKVSPFADIATAMDSAKKGHTVVLKPGTYTGSGNRDILIENARQLTIRSEGNAEETIIDAQGSRHFYFKGAVDSNFVVNGIKFINGSAPDDGSGWRLGGSMAFEGGNFYNNVTQQYEDGYPEPRFYNCVWENNEAGSGSDTGGGGAMLIRHASPRFFNCTFRNNRTTNQGGVVYIQSWDPSHASGPFFRNCTFENNEAYSRTQTANGGAVFIDGGGDSRFIGCRFSGNRSIGENSDGIGGAAYISYNWYTEAYNNILFTRCIFTNNTAEGKNGGAQGGAISAHAPFTLVNSVLVKNRTKGNWGGGGAIHTDIQDLSGTYGESNIINNTIVGNEVLDQNDNLSHEGGGIFMDQGWRQIGAWFNNIIYSNGSGNAQAVRWSDGSSISFGHLCADEGEGEQWWDSETMTMEKPKFKNPGGGDFRLALGSPIIDLGTDEYGGVSAPAVDIRNYYRIGTTDIGAYEFGASKYILDIYDDIAENLETTYLNKGQEFTVTIATRDNQSQLVTETEKIKWFISPTDKYVTILSADTLTSGGLASIKIRASQTTGFKFRVAADIADAIRVTDLYVIESESNFTPPAITDIQISPSSWSSGNNFEVTWTNPDEAAYKTDHNIEFLGAFIKVADEYPQYIQKSTGATVFDVDTASVRVPELGEWEIKVWLVDEFGNEDISNAISVTAKFDDQPPDEFNIHWPWTDNWVRDKPQFRWEMTGDYPSGIATWTIYLDDNEYGTYDNTQVTFDENNGEIFVNSETAIPDGNHNWYMAIADIAGNVQYSNDSLNFGVDITPPFISHSNPLSIVDAGATTPTINVNVSDGASGVSYANLHYRRSGSGSGFVTVDLLSGPVSIPGSDVKEDGLEYYIRSEDNVGNSSVWPGPEQLHSVRVRTDGSVMTTDHWSTGIPSGTEATDYVFFSIPFDVGNAKNAITSMMGQPDEFRYRFYGYNNDWVENPGSVTMGNGYFLIFDPEEYSETPNLSFDFGQGTSTPTDPPYGINVSPGQWKFFGSPYNFSVSLDKVYTDDGTNIRQAGSIYTWNRSWTGTGSLEPWEGYIFKSNGANKLNIDARGSGFAKLAKVFDPDNIPMDVNEWIVDIVASTGNARDELNAIGVRNFAEDGYDPLDEFEPPAVPGDVVLRIDNREREETPDLYAMDIRKPNEQGHYWDLQVFAPTNGQRTYITFDGLGYIPEEYDVFLINKTTKQAKNLKWDSSYRFTNTGPDDYLKQNLRLVIGTKDFVNENNAGVSLYPDAFTLSQNYPNPFNPQTSIMISLEEDARVDLIVYNLLGEEITKLAINDNRPAGYYTFIWDGRNGLGEKVSTGMYFYHALVRDSHGKVVLNKTRKMILLK